MTGVAQLHTVYADFGAVDRVARVTPDNRIAQSSRDLHGGSRGVEQGLTSHQTHYRSYRGRVFTGQMA